VHRLLAALIALSLFALQAQSQAFHTHLLADEHDEHHHGPAIHHHGDAESDRHVDADELTGGRILTITVPAGTTSATALVDIELNDTLAAPELQIAGRMRAIDVRSHGPPAHAQRPPRGPPPSTIL
jgi:hypothetical protein